MVFLRITILLVLVLFFITPATAQVPGRERTIPPEPSNRESEIRKSLEDYYAAEIIKCRTHIATLNQEITLLETRIKDLKNSALQAENDHSAWLKNSRHSAHAKQVKQNELNDQIKKIQIEIDQCQQGIKSKQDLVGELQSLKDKLENDRDFILSKSV